MHSHLGRREAGAMEGLKANSRKGEKHCTLEGKRGKQRHIMQDC